MTWNEVIGNSLLRNLPFKIELNRFGQIVMIPASNKRGRLRAEIGFELRRRKKEGGIIFGCSIVTSDGVKVSDVVWRSDDFIAEFGDVTPYPKAPEICVEVTSPSNSKQEIEHKIELYLAKGALEVWVVNQKREVAFYSHTGQLKKSKLIPKFKL